MKQLLPIGIQDFARIREDGFVYVDKTARIHELITGSGASFFLSRPRRFGKSLLCSTLEAIFTGRRELFGEIAGRPALAINSLDWGWEKHPVIKLSLNVANFTNKDPNYLISVLDDALDNIARRNGLEVRGPFVSLRFSNLIMDMCNLFEKRVVVIIDEYDKPLLDNMTADKTLRDAMRDELRGFYGVLKSSDEHLRFLLLTGVTKFSKVSIFSDLNHLDDLTLDPSYADICGITQEELERDLIPVIDNILEETGRNREEYMENLRLYYDGYRFSEKLLKVYNPFGLLSHFKKGGKFDPYWYETGTPDFLVKLITEQKINIANLSKMLVGFEEFCKYDVEHMKAEPVLYQSGYLTITDYNDNRNRFTLDFPNIEVRSSFMKSLLRQYLQVSEDRSRAIIFKLPDALEDGEIEEAIEAIRQYMAGVPYDIIKETESYFQTVTFLIFKQFGLNCRAELRIADGRIDTIVETKDFVYCFEFKMDKTADEALAQIDTKEYLLPWTGSGKKLFKVGVNFDSEKRNIGEWKYVAVDP
ncbi:MAG: ATP-binding protein [Chitinispirillales bacterium]|jgi:hypothetical protein|nr:ATP-binding protein [Chitinispirillales bacterium]